MYWSNIFLALFTVYITGPYFIYSIFTGVRDEPLYFTVFMALLSMFITMSIRQVAVIWNTPKYISIISILGFLGILMQIAQVWGMMTYLESKWTGVRATSSKPDDKKNSDTKNRQINLMSSAIS